MKKYATFTGWHAIACLIVSTHAVANLGGSPFPTPQVPSDPGQFVAEGRVHGFAPDKHGVAFGNYRYWDGSALPEKAQLPHCTGMVLLARQAFLHGSFRAGFGSKTDAEQAQRNLQSIWNLDAGLGPNAVVRLPFIGYSGLYQMSQEPEMEAAIKNVLSDAVMDATRSDWNWWVTDVFGWSRRARLKSDATARFEIDRGRPVIFYLLDGTETAHAVLAYSYVATAGRVTYELYDPNYPGEVRGAYIRNDDGKMVFEDQAKDPFILFPYRD